MRCHGIAIAAALAMAVASGAVAAADFSGQLEARYGFWQSDRTLPNIDNVSVATLRGKARYALAARSDLRFEGTVTAEQGSEADAATRAEVREAVFAQQFGRGEVRLGLQTFAWGRANRVNPTDMLTARNLRLLVPVDDEQRIGLPGLSAQFDVTDDWRVIGVAQRFAPIELPSARQEAVLPLRLRGSSTEFGLKLDRTGQGFDFSVSYFEGREKTRRLVLAGCEQGATFAAREHPAVRVLGADFATNLGPYSLRGEIARLEVRAGEAVGCGGVPDQVTAVLGVDRNFAGNVNLGIQWFAKQFDQDADPPALPAQLRSALARFQAINSQQFTTQPGMTLRYAQRALEDQLDWEWAAIYNFKTQEYAIRPRLTWRVVDGFRIVAGVDAFGGNTNTPFGRVQNNSGAFIQLHIDLL